jgi:F-type H+-transporting ATPase subunit b
MNVTLLDMLPVIFNFSVVIFILWKYGKDPIRDFFSTRSTQVNEALTEAGEISKQAFQMREEWGKKRQGIQAEIQKLESDAKESLKRMREGSEKKAEHESKRIKKETELLLQGEYRKTQKRISEEVFEESQALVRKYFLKNLDEADRSKLVGDYLGSFGNGSHQG